MTTSSSSNLCETIRSAGIKYIPADRIFYKVFPYKVELSPRFKGLGVISGKTGCQIDVRNTTKARKKLAAFNEKIERLIANVEYRDEIKKFVEQLPTESYKHRLGGENSLFYFTDHEIVKLVCNKYADVINSVTGPINDAHKHVFSESNIVMREHLYYKKFRYVLEFKTSEEFGTKLAPKLMATLDGMSSDTWRAYKLKSVISFYGDPIITHLTPVFKAGLAATSQIYLSDPQDYVYLKLMAGHYISDSHEVKLFSELT